MPSIAHSSIMILQSLWLHISLTNLSTAHANHTGMKWAVWEKSIYTNYKRRMIATADNSKTLGNILNVITSVLYSSSKFCVNWETFQTCLSQAMQLPFVPYSIWKHNEHGPLAQINVIKPNCFSDKQKRNGNASLETIFTHDKTISMRRVTTFNM